MPADVLVVTPSSSLGETIRRSLEETGIYRVHVETNKSSAVVRADEIGVPLALLDMAFGGEMVHETATALRTIRAGINIVILCDDGASVPLFDTLRPWILVRKPFKMANFMNAISQPQPTPASQNVDTTTPWLNDVTKAAQHLTRITLGSSAQAALITRKNDLWAYAGGLSQDAAKEVAQTVTRNWDGQKGSDLLRFIRLESTKAEHMLYATRLTTDTVLALVFEAETPFSTIRGQANQLVSDFSSERPEAQKQTIAPPAKSAIDLSGNPEDDDGSGEDSLNIASISQILTNVPSPNPQPASARKQEKIDPNETRVASQLSNASVFNREASPSIPLSQLITKDQSQISDQTIQSAASFGEINVTAPSQPKQRPETPVARPAPGSLDVTRESPTTEAVRKLVVEPATAGMYHINYACLLIPRFSAHYITGDLAERLGEWLPNICIAFGWRLEYLAVRPEYLQWVANVQPNTSPGYLMRIMRQQTSEKIFSEIIRLKRENPSGDFWAPGYLIMSGTQPHPTQLVRDYIHQTRMRQGQEASPPQRVRN